MPITSINFHGKWAQHHPNYGYDQNSIKILKSDNGLNKIKKVWSKTEQNYDLHFIRSNRTEMELLQRAVSTGELQNVTGFNIQPKPDTITIVYLNNESRGDENNMMTGWILAHRMVHTLGIHTNEFATLNTFHHILSTAYGLNGHDWYSFQNCSLALKLVHAIGTMKSARNNLIPRVAEFTHEFVTQWLLIGKIKFNNLPEKLGLYKANRNLTNCNNLLQSQPEKYQNHLSEIFHNNVGRLFCM